MGALRVVLPLVVVVVAAAGLTSSERPDWKPRLLGNASLTHPAFIELYFSEDSSLEYADRWTLYISTFEALGGVDPVYRVRSPGRQQDPAAWIIELMDQSAMWPNNPDYLPSAVAGAEGVVWTSGFLVPGKKEGQLQLYDTTRDPLPPAVNIASLDNETYSYHRVVWKDMDLDGDLDAVTARFHVSLFGNIRSQFVWLENPGTGFSEAWKQHVLATDGPDISFYPVTLTAGGKTFDCFVMGEFFNRKASIYWTESEDGSWTDPTLVRSRIINENSGQVFDVLVDDFNRDGVQEFIATEFLNDERVGRVTVYFFPEDFRTDNFTFYKIADGFIPNDLNGGQSMSPGTPKAYYPSAEFASEAAEDGLPHKPYILLSGDDDGSMYILFPDSDERDDWLYHKHILVDTNDDIVGKGAHGDLDGDGYEEVVVAGYSVGQLYLYTYAP